MGPDMPPKNIVNGIKWARCHPILPDMPLKADAGHPEKFWQ
jgi:hypothetical protein